MQNTHIRQQIRDLHAAVLELVSIVNQPQRDEALIQEAGISLDRALFPLLIGIDRFGPIGVVELADRAGRDYTTISRQIAKLDELGLIERKGGDADRRVRLSTVTAKGKAMVDLIDAARESAGMAIFESWQPEDVETLVRLLREFVDSAKQLSDRRAK